MLTTEMARLKEEREQKLLNLKHDYQVQQIRSKLAVDNCDRAGKGI